MVLGESGYKDRDGKKEKWKKDYSAKEIKVMKSIFTNARKSGFSACLLWDINFYHRENKLKLLEMIKEYKKRE